MSLREIGKQRRSRRALDAARRILAEQGFEALQMRSIAAEAELSVRTLYNLFGSKGEVLGALMQDELDGLTRALEALAIDDPLDRSRAIITVSIGRFTREADLMRPLLDAAFQSGAGLESDLGFCQARALQEDALSAAVRARRLSPLVPPVALAHQVLSAYNHSAARWARGAVDAAGFATLALHAWACLLLGLARGEARRRLLADVEALGPAMAKLTAEPVPGAERARA